MNCFFRLWTFCIKLIRVPINDMYWEVIDWTTTILQWIVLSYQRHLLLYVTRDSIDGDHGRNSGQIIQSQHWSGMKRLGVCHRDIIFTESICYSASIIWYLLVTYCWITKIGWCLIKSWMTREELVKLNSPPLKLLFLIPYCLVYNTTWL